MSFHLHSMDTPNGLKIRIMLAELELELKVECEFRFIDTGIDIGIIKEDQFSEESL